MKLTDNPAAPVLVSILLLSMVLPCGIGATYKRIAFVPSEPVCILNPLDEDIKDIAHLEVLLLFLDGGHLFIRF